MRVCIPRRSLAAAGVLVAMLACLDSRQPVDPASPRVASVVVAPRFVNEAAFETAPPAIDRIRLTAKQVSDGSVLKTKTLTVNPADAEWQLNLAIPLPDAADVAVVVTIELINSGIVPETVQWSGVTDAFVLKSGSNGTPVDVPVFRGPLGNIGITSVDVTPSTPSVVEGSTTTLNATTPGASSGAVVFWSSLDPTIATVSDAGVVTGVLPGTARIVATAGPKSTTVNVTVRVRVATIVVTPPSVNVPSLGVTTSFTAKAFDPRNAEVVGTVITFSVSPSTVATHTGSGQMVSVGNGSATVTATSAGITGSALMVVSQVPVSIVVSPATANVAVNATQSFSAEVRDGNSRPITSGSAAGVTWSVAPTTFASITGAGVLSGVAQGSVVVTARSATNTTITGTANVTVGTAAPLFTDGFETAAWTAAGSGFWNRTNGVGISNGASPTYVTTSGSSLPAAPQGSFYMWFGSPTNPGSARGNYMGTQAISDPSLSGGNGTGQQQGSVSSPTFTVPAGVGTIDVAFKSWFEVESVEPDQFDLMKVQVFDNATSQPVATLTLNGELTGGGPPDRPFTSGGFGLAPTFVQRTLSVPNAGGKTLRIVLSFDTIDFQYNGFRGWIVDDFRVTVSTALVAPGVLAPLPIGVCLGPDCGRQPTPPRRQQ